MENIVDKVREYVINVAKSKNNFYTYTAYEYHIKVVVERALELALRYNADMEIVEIAALLHDIASITDKSYYEEHHIIGAKLAEELLVSLNYPLDKIERVKQCILNHRGSVLKNKTTIEEICIADADALSHIYSVPSLFYLEFSTKKLSIEDANEHLKAKLTRSYNKLSDDSKRIYKEKFNKTMSIFE